MKFTKPKVYLFAKTGTCEEGISEFFNDIAVDWDPDSHSDADKLTEIAGRVCYRSWQAYDETKPEGTNPNVTKVRQGNKKYIANILKSGHGSVLEHSSATFLVRDLSRVCTHELVRHRAGIAYSQESLRYVRLDELRFYLPECLKSRGFTVEKTIENLETLQKALTVDFGVDGKDFSEKKKFTSAFRRLAPMGLATTIMVTGNLRAWRHVIAMRTSEAAEEEIRGVIGDIARICKREFPNVFQDMTQNTSGEWVFASGRV